MKKVIVIILIIVILALLGVWGYLMFFGTDELPSFDTFFGDSGGTPADFETTFVPDDVVDEEPQNVVIDSLLTQLTTRPVSGAIFLERDGRTFARYAERGTGYIYEIDVETGGESRVSITTEPRTTKVVFAPSGNRAVFTVEISGLESVSFLGNIVKDDEGNGMLDSTPLPNSSDNFAFDSVGDTLFYSVHGSGGTRGFSRNLNTGTDSEIFNIPLRDTVVLWGETIYVYPKPSAHALGGLYEVGTNLSRVGDSDAGLMAEVSERYVVTSVTNENTVKSYAQNTSGGEKTLLAISTFPSKCAFNTSDEARLWCAAPVVTSGELPDEWYQGVIAFEDVFWNVNLENGEAELAFFFSDETDTPIDAVDLHVNEDNFYALFTNKNDQTLWLIDLTLI